MVETKNILKEDEKKKKFNVKPLLVFLGLYLLEIFVTIPFMDVETETFIFPSSIVWFITKIIPLIIVILIYKKRFSTLAKDTKRNFRKFIIYSICAFFIFYLVETGITYYQLLMDKIFEIGESTNQEGIYAYFRESKEFWNYFVLFITIVVLAPLLEEFEFRELIFKTFDGSKYIIPVLVSGILFGAAHLQEFTLQELSYFPIYFIPGVALALIYHYSGRNFYSTYLIHLTINLISFIQIVSGGMIGE